MSSAARRLPTDDGGAARASRCRGQVEYRRTIGADETPRLASVPLDGALGVWMVGGDGAPAVSARLGGP